MVRLFIAIELPKDIRDQFIDVQEVIRRSRAKITLVDPGSIHITLKFIGEIEGSRLMQIIDALKGVTEPRFSMELGTITTNSQKSPRVIWSEVHDDGACKRLANAIETTLYTLGIEKEERRFRPHITIARVRQFHSSLFDQIADICTSCSGSIEVESFVIKKSELTPHGPIYTDIMEFFLTQV